MIYYNDHDPNSVSWLKKLIDKKLIPNGEIDNRSIKDVKPEDVKNFRQCHFFAGIGGWVYALKLANWPATAPVWTGSCPCQPFSVAGNMRGEEDDRHLWPDFFRLISECKPSTIFGEQVAQKAGRLWLDRVRLDLASLGYAVGAADLAAAGIGAPHIRQRLWWVANAKYEGSQGRLYRGTYSKREDKYRHIGRNSPNSRMVHSEGVRSQGRQTLKEKWNPWRDFGLAGCRDGKQRRIPSEPALFPLAHGIPKRVGLLRGAGNAIVPQIAAEFICAFLDVKNDDLENAKTANSKTQARKTRSAMC